LASRFSGRARAAGGGIFLAAAWASLAFPSCSLRNVDDLYGGDAGHEAAPLTCAKDCLGGACVLGKCQPTALVSGRNRPWGVVLDRGDVYWSELGPDGQPGAAFKLVPAAEPVKIIDAKVDPMWLYTYESRLYWVSSTAPGAVGRCPLAGSTGCSYEPGVLVNPPGSIVASGLNGTTYVNNPDSVVADNTGVYWTNAGSRNLLDGSVVVCRATGCGSPGPQILSTSLARPRGIALDETYVYWVDEGLGPDPDTGLVLRIPKVGGTAQKIADHQGSPAYIAVDGTNVYWTNRGSGDVMVWPKSGGDPRLFAPGQGSAWAIAVDASGVYWTTWGPNGSVSTCPASGCDAGVTIVAGALNSPYGIALDQNAIYFTLFDPMLGAVMKIAKP
jgi:hypothetical protein